MIKDPERDSICWRRCPDNDRTRRIRTIIDVWIVWYTHGVLPGSGLILRKADPCGGNLGFYIVYGYALASHCMRAESTDQPPLWWNGHGRAHKRAHYADSGVVSIGNRLVDLIKPLVRATARPAPPRNRRIGGAVRSQGRGLRTVWSRPPMASAPRSRSRSGGLHEASYRPGRHVGQRRVVQARAAVFV